MFEPLRVGRMRASNAVRAGKRVPASSLADGCPADPAIGNTRGRFVARGTGSRTTASLVHDGSDQTEETMSRLLVRNFSISLDGYAAGPHQDLDNPLGVGGTQLHEWLFATRSGRQMIGREGGSEGLDDDFFSERESGVGATIMGRNMFGPIRGPWGESDWTGWWGEDPPFHHPVFVLTHHPHPPIEMQGGTTFYFVDGGIEAARSAAFERSSR